MLICLMSWSDVRDITDRLGVEFETVKRPTIEGTWKAISLLQKANHK